MKNELFEISNKNQKRAWEIIEETQILEIFKRHSITANLVGSLRNGLLMKNHDIDFHVYSDPFSIDESFAAIAEFSKNMGVKHIEYANQLDTDELCIEWHIKYLDKFNELWKFDIIHILKESKYAGWFERVADRVKEVITEETKYSILSIKNQIPDDINVMGIEIYQAVLQDGIKNYSEFINWKNNQGEQGIINWMP